MAIHIEEQREMHGTSMNKTISASAMDMTLDLLQRYQYQYPIKSTIRELVSNGLDSIMERNMALTILNGTKTVEDYFVNIEGEKYVDSKFDNTYYDLVWLSDYEFVHIDYYQGTDLERDRVVITDHGVGLGGKRLEKYFELGYSTKRLSKLPLGKFGIGGKAALSIVDYFTMESNYNGRKYRFNVYAHTINSIIPQLDLEKGVENKFVVFHEGTQEEYKVYYQDTEEKNMVSITIDAKKSHKQQYIDAVKSQLLYFNNIVFTLHTEGMEFPIKYQTEVLYEDEHIVISDNSYWSKPHLLLHKVNYGYINFDELELERKDGNIGIKIAPEDVDINPSRESIIWSDKTKQMVLSKFNTVVDIASKLIQEDLTTIDYIDWLRACASLTAKGYSNNSITGRLAKIIDISAVKPSFLPEPKLKFQQTKILNGLYTRYVNIERRQTVGRMKYILERKELKSVSDSVYLPIFLMKSGERAGNKKDKYILSKNSNGFLLIIEPMTTRDSMLTSGLTEETVDGILSRMNSEGDDFRSSRALMWEYVSKSKEVAWYDDIIVPDNFIGTDEEIDEEDTIAAIEEKDRTLRNKKFEEEKKEKMKILQMSRNERRKLSGKTLIYTPRMRELGSKKPVIDPNNKSMHLMDANGTFMWEPQRIFDWQKIEIPIKDMNDFTAAEIYYGAGPHTDELLHFVAMLSRDSDPLNVLGGFPRRRGSYGIYGKSIEIELNKWKWLSTDTGMYKEKERGLLSTQSVKEIEAYNCQQFYDNEEIMLIKCSNANERYMRDFQPIEQFFQVIKDKKVTMSNLLIRWNTARLIKDKLASANFLFNFSTFNEVYTSLYKRLMAYVDKHYREIEKRSTYDSYFGLSGSTYGDLLRHLDKVHQFQQFVASKPTDSEVSEMAQFMFGNKELQDGQAVDPEMMLILNKVLDYSKSVGPLLNYIPHLTGLNEVAKTYDKGDKRISHAIPDELEMEIKQYLAFKGIDEDAEDDKFWSEINKSNPVEIIAESNSFLLVSEKKVDYNLDQFHQGLSEQAKVIDPNDDLEIPPDQAIMQSF